MVRKALGKNEHKYIETLSGNGYRFNASVRLEETTQHQREGRTTLLRAA